MSKSTRSTLAINAVAQAAAQSAGPALSPGQRLNSIAALAGFVLRMFRSPEPQDALPVPRGRTRRHVNGRGRTGSRGSANRQPSTAGSGTPNHG